MNFWFPLTLLAAAAIFMVLEFRGLRTTLNLSIKGDIKRESRWLAQYGQAVCTAVAAILMAQLDPHVQWRRQAAAVVTLAVAASSLIATIIKRLCSRVRPGRPNAGKFLGPSLKHANYRESFPSSHSASAMALSVMLSIYYPQAAVTFFALAWICGILRFLLDAHWPSDILCGLSLGYLVAWGTACVFHAFPTHP